ncbi:MAG: universal stress protein [Gammaproteobacteria bacterium]|nr:universal stress protein [Gammaproteobacteria bacterium]
MFNKILVPLDIEELGFADSAMEVACDLARQQRGALDVLTVLPGYGSPMVASFFPSDAMAKAKAQAKTELADYVKRKVPADMAVTVSMEEGRHYEEIVRHARKINADLIVISSHNREGLDGVLMGSCAQKVVEHARCSVMVVRPS